MIVEAALIGAAAWRLAAFLVDEDGPLDISWRIRHLIGFTIDPMYQTVSHPDNFICNLFACVWCMSVWTAIGFWVLWQAAPECVMVVAAMSVPPVIERIVKNG